MPRNYHGQISEILSESRLIEAGNVLNLAIVNDVTSRSRVGVLFKTMPFHRQAST